MNARTYIHSLPDSPIVIKPDSYTLIDFKNELGEYLTNKISLCSIAEFVILAYTYTEFFDDSIETNSWVNSNSSVLSIGTINVGSSSYNTITVPLCVYGNTNSPFSLVVNNSNASNNAHGEIKFENDTISNYLGVGIHSSNYSNPTWTIGQPGDAVIYTRDANLQIGTRDGNDITFYTNGAFIGNERFVIKGDGSGYVGINTKNPKTELTVQGSISTNNIIIDSNNNSSTWKDSTSYVQTRSASHIDSLNFIQSISSQLLLKSGGVINGPIITTKTSIPSFLTNELVSKRYVDSKVFETTVSGNFIPSLYYTQTEVDDFLVPPSSVYSYVNENSSYELEVRNLIQSNSSLILQTDIVVSTLSSNWDSVYSYINTSSSYEQDQTTAYLYVLSTSATLLDGYNFSNTTSARFIDSNTILNGYSGTWEESYSYVFTKSAVETQVNNFVTSNSATILNVNTSTTQLSSRFYSAYTYTKEYSSINQETNTYVQNTSGYLDLALDNLDTNSIKWNSVYTTTSQSSATYANKTFSDSKYFTNSGGLITGKTTISGHFYPDTFGVGNMQSASTLGTVIGKIEIFSSNKTSVGFIPVYDNIT